MLWNTAYMCKSLGNGHFEWAGAINIQIRVCNWIFLKAKMQKLGALDGDLDKKYV